MGAQDVAAPRPLHPSIVFDVRNGDFARGSYDDDAADLRRVPVHVQLGLTARLVRDAGGEATGWLVLRSSNGFHAPSPQERVSPRSWYESNNLAALVFTPAAGLRTAAVYTIKASPNGVSPTTHETSVTVAYDGKDTVGRLSPTFAATVRPKGGAGLYTQAGIAPAIDLDDGEDAPTLGFPIAFGIGWGGFYEPGSGTRLFGSVGAALEAPFRVADTRWSARLEALALVRDDRLARLSGPDGETDTVVPLVTLALSMSY